MCFNALISNTDDHPRNHAMIAKDRPWRLSPAYDLTPTPHISKERRDLALICGDQGRIINTRNLLSQSGRFLLEAATQWRSWLTCVYRSPTTGMPPLDVKVSPTPTASGLRRPSSIQDLISITSTRPRFAVASRALYPSRGSGNAYSRGRMIARKEHCGSIKPQAESDAYDQQHRE